DLLGGLGPGVRRSNPPGSAAPVRRLWAATTRVHNARLQVQSVCVFWQTLNRNVDALQDRGHVLLFQPGAAEVHRQAGTWFADPEISAWFAATLHLAREPSLRHYHARSVPSPPGRLRATVLDPAASSPTPCRQGRQRAAVLLSGNKMPCDGRAFLEF